RFSRDWSSDVCSSDLHGRDPVTVAERPVVAAAEPGPGDPDDPAEHDQEVGIERRPAGDAAHAPAHGLRYVGPGARGSGRDHSLHGHFAFVPGKISVITRRAAAASRCCTYTWQYRQVS